MTSTPAATHASPIRGGFFGYLRELWARRDFAWFLAVTDLKARNASTSLGVLWWVLNPLLLSGVYFLVFGLIFGQGRRGNPEYLAHLMSGMFAFQFTAGVTTGAAGSIISNSKLIVNLRFPRLLLPISSILGAGIGFIVSVMAFFAIIIPLTGNWPGWSLLYFVPAVAIQLFLNLGLASIAARLAVPFRDISNLLPYLIRIWLYLSPIIWTLDLLDDVPGWVPTMMHFNPMFNLLAIYRSALLGSPLDPSAAVGAVVSAAILCLFGTVVFVRFERKLSQFL